MKSELLMTVALVMGATHFLGANPVLSIEDLPAKLTGSARSSFSVRLNAQGNEAVVGFSLSFPTNLIDLTVSRGSAASSVVFLTNTNEVAEGRIGVLLGKLGQSLGIGDLELARFEFGVPTNTQAFSIAFTNTPIFTEIAQVQGFPVTMSTIPARATVVQPLRIQRISTDANSVQLEWSGGEPAFRVDGKRDLTDTWKSITTVDQQNVTIPRGEERFFRIVSDP